MATRTRAKTASRNLRILAPRLEARPLGRAAAIYDAARDQVMPIRRDTILAHLKAWAERADLAEVILIADSLGGDLPGLREGLAAVAGRGVTVRWFTRGLSDEIIGACKGLDGVTLIKGTEPFETLWDAGRIERLRPALARLDRDLSDWDSPLSAFLRVWISLAVFDRTPLAPSRSGGNAITELVAFLADIIEARGGEYRPSASDQQLIDLFRDADFPYFEGASPRIVELRRRIEQVAATDLNVLITGETGTGKEIVAFFLHALSDRAALRFVAVNCAGLDETFLKSELFGHTKGAFTGAERERAGAIALAEGGTLFLDEIGDLAPNLQADLLRFVQTRRYRKLGSDHECTANVKLVCAGQPTLARQMEIGLFRRDFYYRIAEATLYTPALREIREDLRDIIRNLIYRYSRSSPDHPTSHAWMHLRHLEGRGRDAMLRYDWPGNVRELASMIKRMVILEDDIAAEVAALVAARRSEWAEHRVGDAVAGLEPPPAAAVAPAATGRREPVPARVADGGADAASVTVGCAGAGMVSGRPSPVPPSSGPAPAGAGAAASGDAARTVANRGAGSGAAAPARPPMEVLAPDLMPVLFTVGPTIRPLRRLMCEYIRHVDETCTHLTARQRARALQISYNTLVKFGAVRPRQRPRSGNDQPHPLPARKAGSAKPAVTNARDSGRSGQPGRSVGPSRRGR